MTGNGAAQEQEVICRCGHMKHNGVCGASVAEAYQDPGVKRFRVFDTCLCRDFVPVNWRLRAGGGQ